MKNLLFIGVSGNSLTSKLISPGNSSDFLCSHRNLQYKTTQVQPSSSSRNHRSKICLCAPEYLDFGEFPESSKPKKNKLRRAAQQIGATPPKSPRTATAFQSNKARQENSQPFRESSHQKKSLDVVRKPSKRQSVKQIGGVASSGEKKNSKKHTTLLKALCVANVASSDTCERLIRHGMVEVNGKKELDAFKNIVLPHDVVKVSGEEVMMKEEIGEEDEDLPAGMRDFGGGRMEEIKEKSGKKYNWRVDRGFFAMKRGYKGTN
eukprot:CAMPEP_0182445124 /NCGR_PEP_ID=MMETSP1172-20130603/3361_1 /TAXON_ID=708627 /ORGANISM="Timspurckia oligopyrenoides, Strain CCMP3278" /LENGTH=262 /DNA_ID=CAMNT_0024640835 /DNA_START=43 /DNA_END=831 /DNA_ORIENTATION=+